MIYSEDAFYSIWYFVFVGKLYQLYWIIDGPQFSYYPLSYDAYFEDVYTQLTAWIYDKMEFKLPEGSKIF